MSQRPPKSASLETGSGPRRCIRNGVSGEREVEGDNEAQNRTTSEPPPPLTEPHPPAPDCTGQHEWSFSRDSLIHALGGVFTFATQSKPTCPVPPPLPWNQRLARRRCMHNRGINRSACASPRANGDSVLAKVQVVLLRPGWDATLVLNDYFISAGSQNIPLAATRALRSDPRMS